jgi:very-short-patch-repair endonuclease
MHASRRINLKKDLARTLRSNSTEAERKLWHCLRDKRLEGIKFRRQQPIGPFVADFYCAPAKLIVEIDGSQHAEERACHDEKRTRWLEARGHNVLRFWNSDLQDSDHILGVISYAIGQMNMPQR